MAATVMVDVIMMIMMMMETGDGLSVSRLWLLVFRSVQSVRDDGRAQGVLSVSGSCRFVPDF